MKIKVLLTASAAAYARKHALSETIDVISFDPWTMVGDVVAVTAGEAKHYFVVHRRFVCHERESTTLKIELDHPVR
jgi:hypothetical protein